MPAQTIDCKICGHPAELFGTVDSTKSCNGAPLPLSGVMIPYHRCAACGFLFTAAFDEWYSADFLREIYNGDYALADPEFATIRPLSCAASMEALLAPRRGSIRLLDYGGGAGVFARRMNELGFDAASYDPFYKGGLEPRLGEKFELIHCREVIEHAPQPRDFAQDLVRFLAQDGAVYMSTELQPPNILDIGLRWAYAGPRNGHISLFTRESLAMIWQDLGLNFGSFDANHHIAWRGKPACYSCLVKE